MKKKQKLDEPSVIRYVQKYIEEQNKKGKKLFGGIVIPVDENWRYNDNENYFYNPKDLKDWKFLNLN